MRAVFALNEAFGVQSLTVLRTSASGPRGQEGEPRRRRDHPRAPARVLRPIATTLLRLINARNKDPDVAARCIGSDKGVATIFERA